MDLLTGGISSSLNNIYGTSTGSQTKAEQLSDKLKNSDYSKATDEELMNVCKEFESYLVEQMFKAMEKMVPEREDNPSSVSALDYFGDMLTRQYASNATEQGSLGIAETLYEQMKRNYNISEAE